MNDSRAQILVVGLLLFACCGSKCFLHATEIADASATIDDPIDFNRQIRPILSDRCFHCHGPDSNNQDSNLRLDTKQNAFADLGGYFAIAPHDLDKSELHGRIHSDDENELMPPPESNRELSESEIALLDAWIRQGAPFDKHWSLNVPTRPSLPNVDDPDWATNAIDQFVLARLKKKNLSPSPKADLVTLLRRVTLDLTGLPPTPDAVDAFLADESHDAYEQVVDRLLASPQFGERMALPWLDAARYADSAGYQNDFQRSQWPWRDWVVRALNANMPFDQFSIEQLAGDLLPNPTQEQLLATGFNRNHRINNEGGIIPQEFLVEYVADRVETTGTVWLGMTIGCARCHDHKYDPITQKDFYQLFAFFHNIDEKGKDGDVAPAPNMPVYTSGSKAEHEAIAAKLAVAEKELSQSSQKNEQALEAWVASEKTTAEATEGFAVVPPVDFYFPLDFITGKSVPAVGKRVAKNRGNEAKLAGEGRKTATVTTGRHGKGVAIKQGRYVNLGKLDRGPGWTPIMPTTLALWVNAGRDVSSVEGPLLSCMTPGAARQGYQLNLVDPGDDLPYRVAFRCFSNRKDGEGIVVVSEPSVPRNTFTHVAVAYDGSALASGVTLFVDGRPAVVEIQKDNLQPGFSVQEELLAGAETESSVDRGIRDELLTNSTLDDIRIYRDVLNRKQIRTLYRLNPTQLIASCENSTETAKNFLARTYSEFHDPTYRTLLKRVANMEAANKKFEAENITYVSIMKEMETPRETHVLVRGAYDAPDDSEKLNPATPAAVLPLDERFPANRLGLAEWLFADDNPLVARVAVNRYWQNYFGTGIVKTPEDFGSQGAPPSHPELLDWLAIEFRESGWDVKAMQKRILMSSTYRQSSVVTPDLLQKDPENRLLARGPRFRLYAHAIRDQALAAGGLLVDRRGGPPVMPYQPEGLWDEVSAKGFKYVVADTDDLYRRSVYTFWRRTVPPPSMMNFDTSAREACSVTTSRTNTPLQAMNLLNDPTYVEAARALAQRMMTAGGPKTDSQLSYGMKLLVGSTPSPNVLSILRSGHGRYLKHFTQDPQAAKEFISVGNSVKNESLDPIELAALTAVASVMLNLDVTVTKQ